MTSALITGANRGIGLELCRQLCERGMRVLAVCRTPSRELEGLAGVQVVNGIDVTDDSARGRLADVIGDETIDVLINNAGLLEGTSLEAMDVEAIRRQFEVNSIAPLMVTHAVLDKLSARAKVAVITSRMGSIADNTSGGAYGYRMSKAAVNAAFVSLSHDLKPRGISVVILHPGFVRTNMTGGNGMVDAQESAAGLLARIDELSLETTGRFLHMNGEPLPW